MHWTSWSLQAPLQRLRPVSHIKKVFQIKKELKVNMKSWKEIINSNLKSKNTFAIFKNFASYSTMNCVVSEEKKPKLGTMTCWGKR